MRQKIFGKSWHPPPFYAWKLFETGTFPKPGRVPLPNFSPLWCKNFLTVIRNKPPSYPWNFRNQNFSEAQNGFRYEMFRQYEPKKIDGKSWCPHLIHKIFIFRYRNFSETQKGSSTKCFDNVLKVIWYLKISETQNGFPYESFRYCEAKNFRR